ncbi:hypothetical protein G6O67_003164 [Ophiocordyceps sinensis]|uniref:Uncharacterized protein n=2 Tax=Ophiocordyceps sinensis TaxID=72228 RepID=A0A8H4PVQ6_9HYPO|nr:hypothetical protein OCS_05837 [Ophiocordyceps sinensis CO18]KAF4511358.1 hypothetical protein G6O67_003164 [Ophiocordyceps sinensis]
MTHTTYVGVNNLITTSPASPPVTQIPRLPRFTGGGDLEKLSLGRLLLLADNGESDLRPLLGPPGELDLPRRRGGGDGESYEGDRPAGLALRRGVSSTDELFLRCPPLTLPPGARPRRSGLGHRWATRRRGGGDGDRLYELDDSLLALPRRSRASGERDKLLLPSRGARRAGEAE